MQPLPATTSAFAAANVSCGGGANTAFDRANVDISNVNFVNTAVQAAFAKANNAGGRYYKGNNGQVGSVTGKNDIFHVNNNYLNSNIYFDGGENASARDL
jgi:hypothetical protein